LIETTFQEEGAWKKRSFRFVGSGSGVQNETLSASDDTNRITKVRLSGFKEKYRVAAPKKLETIGAHIVEHCLDYLIRSNPPHLVLNDDSTKESIDLNELFDKEMSQNAKSIPFKVGPAKFQILHVKLYSSHQKEHMLYFCANNRAVKSERLAGQIPDLARKLFDENQREFLYAAYLDGEALDQTVNQERTDFTMCSEEGHIFESGVSWSQIRGAAAEQIKSYLAPFTKPVKERKAQRLERFVATTGPMYRPILKYVAKDVALLDPDIDDSELDIKLYKAYHDFQVQLRVEGRELIEADEARDDEFAEYAEKYDSYFLKVGDVNKSDLARYVFDRKLVLQFLQKILGIQSTGKYALEKKVHNLIFPMGKTSEDVLFDNHNLRLLDERLAYHKYLGSDKPLRATEPLVNESRKELDLIVFDKACAFVNSTDSPFQTITIVEFKRPMRDGYSSQENPFEQVLNYIDEIKAGRARTPDGRDIPISEGVHYYCYVVADKTSGLEVQALRVGLEKTADNQGFYGYNPGYKAYIEFISYSKLLSDAKQRNQVFFEKLGLPSAVLLEQAQPEVPPLSQEEPQSLFGD
jgi:hypothetical protein